MDKIASGEFRKRYASLTEPTIVTVNGHVIGQWTPSGPPSIKATLDRLAASPFVQFRPAPKPGKGRNVGHE